MVWALLGFVVVVCLFVCFVVELLTRLALYKNAGTVFNWLV